MSRFFLIILLVLCHISFSAKGQTSLSTPLEANAPIQEKITFIEKQLDQLDEKTHAINLKTFHSQESLVDLKKSETTLQKKLLEDIQAFNKATVKMLRIQRMPHEALLVADILHHQRHKILKQSRKTLTSTAKNRQLKFDALEKNHQKQKQAIQQLIGLKKDLFLQKDAFEKLLDVQKELLKLPPENRDILKKRAEKIEKSSSLASFFTLQEKNTLLPKIRSSYHKLPVHGEIVKKYNQADKYGILSRGVTILVTPGATVTALQGGRVIYSGLFRGYGYLVILEHADGYHTLYSGLSGSKFQVGDLATAGSVVGSLPDQGQPHLYLEVRHEGAPVNPMPWLKKEKLKT